MIKCINHSHPDYKQLERLVPNKLILDAYIDEFQNTRSTEAFPPPTWVLGKYKSIYKELPTEFETETIESLKRVMHKLGVDMQGINDYFNNDYPNFRPDVLGIADMLKKVIALSPEATNFTFVEEAAHFIVAALPKNARLKRVLDDVVNTDEFRNNVDEYTKVFKNDPRNAGKSDAEIIDMVKMEVLGKLVAKRLFTPQEIQESLPVRLYNGLRRLFRMFKDIVTGSNNGRLKRFLNDLDARLRSGNLDLDSSQLGTERYFEVDSGLFEIKDDSGKITGFKNLFFDKYNFKSNKNLDLDPEKFKEHRDPYRATLLDALQRRIKKLRIYHHTKEGKLAEQEAKNVEILKDRLHQHQITMGYVDFINMTEKETIDTLKRVNAIGDNINSDVTLEQLAEYAGQMKQAHGYVTAYEEIVEYINSEVRSIGTKGIEEDAYNQVKETTTEILANIQAVKNRYKEFSKLLIAKALWPFAENNPMINSVDTLVDILSEREGDLNFIRSFMSSMAESTDDALGLLDQLMKLHKDKARLNAEKYIRDLVRIDLKLKKNGIKDTKWMAEYDDDGEPTGFVASMFHWGAYNKERRNLYKRLKEKYNLPKRQRDVDLLFGTNVPYTAKLKADQDAWIKKNRDVKITVKEYDSALQMRTEIEYTIGEYYDKKKNMMDNQRTALVMKKLHQSYKGELRKWYEENTEIATWAIEDEVKRLLEIHLGEPPTKDQIAEFIRSAHTDHKKLFGKEYQTKADEVTRTKKAGLDDPGIARQFELALEDYTDWLGGNREYSERTKDYFYKNDLNMPKLSKWGNQDFINMQKSTDFKDKLKMEYYRAYMKTKQDHDKHIPKMAHNPYRMPMVRKDLIQRLNDKWKDPKDAASTLGRHISENLQRTEQDTEFGSNFVLTDENDNPVKFVPIHYTTLITKYVDENGKRVSRVKASKDPDNYEQVFAPEDLSLDFTESMSLYVMSAQNYIQVSKVIKLFEVAKDVLRDRKITEGEDLLGKVSNYFRGKKAVTERGGKAFKRFEDYLNMVGYGELKKDEGAFLGFDIAKSIDAFNMYTSIQGLALNVYSGFANITHGNAMLRQEGFAGEEFSNKDLLAADKIYWTSGDGIMGLVKDIGLPVSNNKLRVVGEYLDVLQNFKARNYELNTSRGRMERLFTTSSLFFINNIGEHQMQYRTALAMMNNTKLYKDGKELNAWDAVFVEDGQLRIKQGVTKDKQGLKRFSLEDFAKLGRRIQAVNQSLYGIYNEVDRSSMQQYSLGRMALVFRKFMVPGIHRRWGKKYYNYEREHFVEGIYMTFGRFIALAIKDLQHLKKIYNSEAFSDQDRANIIRAATEIAQIIMLWIAGSILLSWSSEDDDNEFLAFSAYQANRLYSELTFNVNPKEFIRLIQSPAAGINQLETILRLTKTFDVTGALIEGDPFLRRYKSGSHEGQTYLWVTTTKLIPLYDNIADWFEADEKLKFYTN
jgi:hypothetical protein